MFVCQIRYSMVLSLCIAKIRKNDAKMARSLESSSKVFSVWSCLGNYINKLIKNISHLKSNISGVRGHNGQTGREQRNQTGSKTASLNTCSFHDVPNKVAGECQCKSIALNCAKCLMMPS